MNMEKSNNILKFLQLCHQLKTTKRTGWVNNNVELPESISDHMYFMAIISWVVDEEKCDKNKCIKMALVHDLAESIVGDITPYDGISDEEKFDMENKAMKELAQLVDEEIGNEIYNLWLEYEKGETPESQLVKQIDKFEMALQAYQYEKNQKINLERFYQSVEGKLTNPYLTQWFQQLKEERKGFNLPDPK